MKKNGLPANYVNILDQLKDRIRSARVKASLSVNKELIGLYLDIGKDLARQEEQTGWGSGTVEALSRDLKRAFPGMKGFSRSNLFYMKQMYLEYAGVSKKVQQLVGQIPWGQNLVIMSRVKNPKEREWYLRKVLENGWSRAILIHQIESSASSRQGKAITNFPKTLSPPQSEFAGSMLKDPYCLEFLDIGPDIKERELELKLLDHLKEFLIELGRGFAFVGSQVHLEVGKKRLLC